MNCNNNNIVMKNKLYNILAKLNDIQSQVESMTYILKILEEAFETQNQMEPYYLAHMARRYNEGIEYTLLAISEELDVNILQM